jgi:hypothetical protein
MMRAFGSDEAGKRAGEAACRAIGALANVGQIDTMITNFLVPLQVTPHLIAQLFLISFSPLPPFLSIPRHDRP